MCSCTINVWLITRVTCQMIHHVYIVLVFCSNIEEKCMIQITLL